MDLLKALVIGVTDEELRLAAIKSLALLAGCLGVACLCYGLSLVSDFPGWLLVSFMGAVSTSGAVLSWRTVDLLVRVG